LRKQEQLNRQQSDREANLIREHQKREDRLNSDRQKREEQFRREEEERENNERMRAGMAARAHENELRQIAEEQLAAQEQIAHESHLNEIKSKLLDIAMDGISDPRIAGNKASVLMEAPDFVENLGWFWPTISRNGFLINCYMTAFLSEIDYETDFEELFSELADEIRDSVIEDTVEWARQNHTALSNGAIVINKINEYSKVLAMRAAEAAKATAAALERKEARKKKCEAVGRFSAVICTAGTLSVAWPFISLWVMAWREQGFDPNLSLSAWFLAKAGSFSLSSFVAVWTAIACYVAGLISAVKFVWQRTKNDLADELDILPAIIACAIFAIKIWALYPNHLVHIVLIVSCVVLLLISFIRSFLSWLGWGIVLGYTFLIPAIIVGWTAGSLSGWLVSAGVIDDIATKNSYTPMVGYQSISNATLRNSNLDSQGNTSLHNTGILEDSKAHKTSSAAPRNTASSVDDKAALPKTKVDEPLFDNSFRTWTATNGKSVKARIISTNSTNVILECEDGTVFAQPEHLLIDEDRLLASRFSPHSSSSLGSIEGGEPFQGESFIAQKTPDGFLNVRSGPGLKNSVVGKIRSGSRGIMQVGETIHDTKDQIIWMPVRFGGVSGFVSSNFLKPE
jgi:hypothetical protein